MLGRLERLVVSVRQDRSTAIREAAGGQAESRPPDADEPLEPGQQVSFSLVQPGLALAIDLSNVGQDVPETGPEPSVRDDRPTDGHETQQAGPESGQGGPGLPVDPGTGLYRWWVFRNRLLEEIARADRRNHQVSVLLLEPAAPLPESHDEGTYVRAAQTLRQAIRAYDFAARFDEERFVVLLPETDATEAEAAAKRILSGIASGGKPPVPWQAAMVTYPDHGTDLMELLDEALALLHRSRLESRQGQPCQPDSNPDSSQATS